MMQKTSGLCANNLVDFEDLRSRLRVPFSIEMIMLMCWSTLSLEQGFKSPAKGIQRMTSETVIAEAK